MKIRMSFVSNSSSSSFCILAKKFEPEELDFIQEAIEAEKLPEEFTYMNVYGEFLHPSDPDLSVTAGMEDYEGKIFIGLEPEKMKPDETLNQLKMRICKNAKSIFNVNIKPEELKWWYDQGRI